MKSTHSSEREGKSKWPLTIGCVWGAALGLDARTAALPLGISVSAGMIAQTLLDRDAALGVALGLYAFAASLFVVLSHTTSLESKPDGPIVRQRTLRWEAILVAWGLGILAWPRFSGNRFSEAGTGLWLLGFGVLGLMAWRPDIAAHGRRAVAQRTCPAGVTLGWHHLALLGAMAIGGFYRLYRIGFVPLEMGCDLPLIYENIRLVMQRQFLIFFPAYPGREALFFYLAAPFCGIFGLSHTTIKTVSALLGVVTIPAIYLLGRELYDRRVGVYAAFLLSVSHWHAIITRAGLRSCTMPPILILMWYFLVRALKTERPWFYGLAGLFLGLGFYTYNAFMVAPLLVLVMLVACALSRVKWSLSRQGANLALLVLVAAYVCIPLARYAFENPETYLYRVATRVTSLEQPLPMDMVGTFLANTLKALGMFNYRGDGVYISNVPFCRELGFFTAVFFVLGLAYAIWRWRRGYNGTVLVGLGIMLLPTILSLAFPDEVPNAGRAFGALPAAMILPALSLTWVHDRMARRSTVHTPGEPVLQRRSSEPREWRLCSGIRPYLAKAFLGMMLLSVLVSETWALYPLYFTEYVWHLPGHNYSISLEMAQEIAAFDANGKSYIKAAAHWYDGNAVRAQLLSRGLTWEGELSELDPDAPPLSEETGKVMVILHREDVVSLQALRQAYPSGITLEHLDNDGEVSFITFYGER